MPAFAYHAIDAAGRRQRGSEEAPSAAALKHLLEARGLLVLDVAAGAADAGSLAFGGRGLRRGVLELTRALAALLPAGVPLARALGIAAGIVGGPAGGVIGAVRARVERGGTLAEALSEHPRCFSPFYLGMIRAGEKSGDLPGAFRRLAEQLERDDKLRTRLVSASIYPLLLTLFGGAALLVLMLFVLPRFVELLQDAGATLPRSTALLLSASATAARLWPLLLLAPPLVALLGGWARFSESGRRAWALLLIRTPGIGWMRRQTLAARFARLAGVLLAGGAPLYTALGDARGSLADPLAQDEVERVRERVRAGGSLHGALGEGALFPPLLPQLVAVGEESSRLEEFLLKAADIFEDRTEQATQRLVTLAEPMMIVVFGTLVAFVALSLLQAIYSVNAGGFR
jgi:general secretion pathway protein F